MNRKSSMAFPLPENGGHRLQAAPKDAMRSSPVSRRAERPVGAPVSPPLPGAQVRRAAFARERRWYHGNSGFRPMGRKPFFCAIAQNVKIPFKECSNL